MAAEAVGAAVGAAAEVRPAVKVVPQALAGCAAAAARAHHPGDQARSCTRAGPGGAALLPPAGCAAAGQQGLLAALTARGMACCWHPGQLASVEAPCRRVPGSDKVVALRADTGAPKPILQQHP